MGERLGTRGKEFGTVTGRQRRCGWFDACLGRYAARLNGLTELLITKLDVLSGFETVKICTGYRAYGQTFDDMPPHQSVFHDASPIYEELEGWHEEIDECRTFDDLPKQAQRYVRRMEELVGVPVERREHRTGSRAEPAGRVNELRSTREGRLRRIAFGLTLAGLAFAAPTAIAWITGDSYPGSRARARRDRGRGLRRSEHPVRRDGARRRRDGRAAGDRRSAPCSTTPTRWVWSLLVSAPIAEVAASVAAFGYPERLLVSWRGAFADIRAATARAVASWPLRMPDRGPWLLDRITVVTAVGATLAIAGWAVLVATLGAGDDPTTRTVLPASTEFPWALGVGLALSVVSAVLSVLTGRVPGVLMALPVLPAVWLDAPQRSEVVVVVLAAACGLISVLATPVPAGEIERPSG